MKFFTIFLAVASFVQTYNAAPFTCNGTVREITSTGSSYKNPYYVDNRTVMVHLFEWKFSDIAKECETFLGPMGYAGVQVSPVNEYLIIPNRPWYERYQPVSYIIKSRSGNAEEMKDMVKRCNDAGVRIYIDVVFNHMSGDPNPGIPSIGTAGSLAFPESFRYPGVPYDPVDFNKPSCSITDYQNATNIRDCELSGLRDLNQTREEVRGPIVNFLNELVDYGVAGFRVDAAKHMWPEDLKVIYSRVKDLNPEFGFPNNARPFIFQEVIDVGLGEAVEKYEYTFAEVLDFQVGVTLGYQFRGEQDLTKLQNWGNVQAWRLMEPGDAVVFIDNHDNQRGHGAGGESILNYKEPKPYIMALAFMLAHPYGNARIISSFNFSDPSHGPPMDDNEEILSPEIRDNTCINGWVCEHRWTSISNMAAFRNKVGQAPLENWWSREKNQIAFSRGNIGFVAFNAGPKNLKIKIKSGLPGGEYCDIISGSLKNGQCTGIKIKVSSNGRVNINIPANAADGVIAISIDSKLETDKSKLEESSEEEEA